jgi:hypothetical protein
MDPEKPRFHFDSPDELMKAGRLLSAFEIEPSHLTAEP